jgi:hypothetical protein
MQAPVNVGRKFADNLLRRKTVPRKRSGNSRSQLRGISPRAYGTLIQICQVGHGECCSLFQ